MKQFSVFTRIILSVVAVLGLVGLGLAAVASAADHGPGPKFKAVEPIQFENEDDANPPPAPPNKAAAAKAARDLPRTGRATNPHDHLDADVGDPDSNGLDLANDPDIWSCTRPDGSGYGVIMHLPSVEVLKAMRQHVLDERETNPAWVPVIEYAAVPADCETIEGKPSFEEFYRARSIAAVFRDDGSIASVDELKKKAGS